MPSKLDRRSLLRKAAITATGLLLPAWATGAAAIITPSLTEGPFYPRELPLDSDSDLTRVQGAAAPARGQILDLTGRVLDVKGRPLAATQVEIWQCNAYGRYRHPDDRSDAPLDAGFQGFGKTITDGEGRYRFRTIKPVPYPGRTPHIHFRLASRQFGQLTTQMFVAGEPLNERDGLFRRLRDDEARRATVAILTPAAGSGVDFTGQFDIVLGG